MYPNKFYTEWLVNEIVKLNKKRREYEHTIDERYTNNAMYHYYSGYIAAIDYFLKELRDVANYDDQENDFEEYEEELL